MRNIRTHFLGIVSYIFEFKNYKPFVCNCVNKIKLQYGSHSKCTAEQTDTCNYNLVGGYLGQAAHIVYISHKCSRVYFWLMNYSGCKRNCIMQCCLKSK